MTAIRIVIASALITAGLIKGTEALAEPACAGVNVSIVHTADLDLSSSAGQRQLEVRLAQAARDVCGTASDVDLAGKNAVRACRVDVLTKARATSVEAASNGSPITISAGR